MKHREKRIKLREREQDVAKHIHNQLQISLPMDIICEIVGHFSILTEDYKTIVSFKLTCKLLNEKLQLLVLRKELEDIHYVHTYDLELDKIHKSRNQPLIMGMKKSDFKSKCLSKFSYENAIELASIAKIEGIPEYDFVNRYRYRFYIITYLSIRPEFHQTAIQRMCSLLETSDK